MSSSLQFKQRIGWSWFRFHSLLHSLQTRMNENTFLLFSIYQSIDLYIRWSIIASIRLTNLLSGLITLFFSMRKKQTYRSFPFNVCERKYFNTFFSIEWEKLERRRRFNVCSRWFASKIFAYLFYLLSKSRRKVKTKNDNSTTNRNTPNTSHRKNAHKHIRAEWASGQEIEGKKGAKLLLSGF